MIRRSIAKHVMKVAGHYPVVTVLGPRQSGKTTLAKAMFPDYEYRNLEAEDVLMAARDDPRGFLMQGTRRMIVDEVQRFPGLLTYIQEFADAKGEKGMFVLTGSQQPALAEAVGESLAGRTDCVNYCHFPLRNWPAKAFPWKTGTLSFGGDSCHAFGLTASNLRYCTAITTRRMSSGTFDVS